MTEYICPKCNKVYEWRFEKREWAERECLIAYCDCGCDGEQCGILQGEELEDHKRYNAEQLWWKRASDEQKKERLEEDFSKKRRKRNEYR